MVVYRERCNSEPETVSVPVFNMKTATPRQQVPYIAQRVTGTYFRGSYRYFFLQKFYK